MSPSESATDHWTASLDVVELLRERLARETSPDDDPVTRQLMTQVAHAKSSSFVVLLDAAGHVLDVNPAALIAGGLDRAEVIGLPLPATGWWAELDPAAVAALETAITAAGAGRFSRFDTDVRIEHGGSETGTLDLLLRPLRGRDGRVAFIVVEGRQITDRKRVEQRLERQNAELSALTQRLARVHDYRERLLGELSHDMRAPLQAVVARAEQILRGDPDPDLRAQIMSIRLASLSALEQINDMLEQVRADHGETRLALVDADLSRAVRTVSEQFAPLAEDQSIDLELDVTDGITARFDVERISRVVSNLLANAIRHTPAGGTIRVALAADGATGSLSVADSGPGVPVEHRARVFGRFRSSLAGDGRDAGTGAGLGLAIVREFVELHGGDITLDEAPQGGALFTVTLPLHPPGDETAAATLAQHAAAAQRTEYVRSKLEVELTGRAAAPVPTVVIVERVPGRADVIVRGIGDGAVTCVAEDAVDALRLAQELRPTAVVVGTSTGDLPATSLLRRLAADERLADVHRVALVGEREEDHSTEQLVAAGAQLVLPAASAEQLGGRLWAAAECQVRSERAREPSPGANDAPGSA